MLPIPQIMLEWGRATCSKGGMPCRTRGLIPSYQWIYLVQDRSGRCIHYAACIVPLCTEASGKVRGSRQLAFLHFLIPFLLVRWKCKRGVQLSALFALEWYVFLKIFDLVKLPQRYT